MTTYWDCIWKDSGCMLCQYFHKLVQQEKRPTCPRGLRPRWRRLIL